MQTDIELWTALEKNLGRKLTSAERQRIEIARFLVAINCPFPRADVPMKTQ